MLCSFRQLLFQVNDFDFTANDDIMELFKFGVLLLELGRRGLKLSYGKVMSLICLAKSALRLSICCWTRFR